MVYACLLKGGSMHRPMVHAKMLDIRGFTGCIGEHVLSLPIFQNTAGLGQALLIIECKTPGKQIDARAMYAL